MRLSRRTSARLEQVRQVSVPPTRVTLPALYLQATADRVLPAAALEEVEARFSDLEVVRLRGPHLLLNAMPEATADAVARFATRIATRVG